jgi:hypothetical protein
VIEGFVSGAIAGLALSLMIGMVPVLVVELGARRGMAIAVAAGAGVAAGRAVWGAAGVTIGSQVPGHAGGGAGPFEIIGAAILVAVAVRGLVWILLGPRGIPANADLPTNTLPTFMRLAAIAFLDRIAIATLIALGVGLNSMASASGGPAGFVGGVFIGTLAWHLLLGAIGAFGRRRFPSRGQAIAAVVGNGIVIGFAALIVAEH